jgi:hypothetical protein
MRYGLPAPRDLDGEPTPEIGRGLDEAAIERYLSDERRAAARRILGVGAVALTFGAIGLVPLWHWLTEGGVAPRVVLAAPLLLCIGAVLTVYGLAARARA